MSASFIKKSFKPRGRKGLGRVLGLLRLEGGYQIVLAFIGLEAVTSPAQEAVRMSQADQDSSETRKLSHATIGYYNLELGSLSLRFASSAGVQYNDNINLQQNNRESDVILQPGFSTDLRYPVSDQNTLNLTIGAGYSAYLSHSSRDYYNISPGSELSFDVFVSDVKINLHDRVSVLQNTYQNPTANGNSNESELQNTVGLNATDDMNRLWTKVGYDHNNTVWLGSGQSSQPNGSSDLFFGNLGVHCPYNIVAGLEAGGGFINYDQVNNDNLAARNATEVNLGIFAQGQITDYLNAQINAGYAVYSPESSGSQTNLTENSGLYFGLTVTHRVNRLLNYSISAGKSQQLSTYGEGYDSYYVRLQPDWNVFQKMSLSTPLFWEHGTYYYSGSGSFDQYGGGLTLGRPITQHLSSSFSYQFIKETSDTASYNYTVNIVSLNFTYQF